MNTPTHAKNRHFRRQANRYEPKGPQVGQPINGPLTPTEIAHKARRRARRPIILRERKANAQARLDLIKANLKLFRKNVEKNPELKSDIKRLEIFETELQAQVNKLDSQLQSLS